jgi:hypothetical protein
MRGTMLWFNNAKDVGLLQADDGERIGVPGAAFLSGEKPAGRCAGQAVEFESHDGSATSVAFLTELRPRRARSRHRR